MARTIRLRAILVPALACLVPLALRAAGSARDAQEAPPRSAGEGIDERDTGEEAAVPRREPPPLPKLEESGRIAAETTARNAPFLVARQDGRITLGAVEWTPGAGDRVEIRDALRPDGTGEPARALFETHLEIVRPVGLLDARGRLNVLWTQLVDGRAQLAWAREQDGAFTPPVVLTRGPHPNLNPEAALAADGRIHVAWEADVEPPGGRRAGRDVLLAPLLEEGRLGAVVRVGDGRFSDVDPVVAASGGRLWIAWAAYAGHDYEIRLRSFDPAGGELGGTIEVSADPAADDVHPCLAVSDRGEPWIAWDRVEVSQRGCSSPPDLRVISCRDHVDVSVQCAVLREGRVLAPEAGAQKLAGTVVGAPELSTGGGAPRIAFDRAGRLWIAYRHLRSGGRMLTRFPLIVQSLSEQGWSAPLEVDGSGGLTEPAALVRDGERLVVAYYRDRRGRDDRAVDVPEPVRGTLAVHGVRPGCWYGAASIGLAVTRPAEREPGVPLLVARAPPPVRNRDRSYELDLDDPILSGERHHEIARGEERFLALWGDLHRHSAVSRCMGGIEPMPAGRWTSGRDVHLCDFMALTDHSSHTDPWAWWQLDKMIWLHESDRFCTLAGYEWSTRAWGHHNVILPGRLAPFSGRSGQLDLLYRELPAGRAITIPHHSSHLDFPVPFDACEDGLSRLVEIYQAMRGSYEADGCFKQAATAFALGSFVRDALQQGREFGIIASTDHGFGASYAVALARGRDRASVFEALHSRRTYGATVKGILVDFRVGDALMGEKVELAGPARVRVEVRGTAELAEVAVFKDGRTFRSAGRRGERLNELAPLRLAIRLTPGGAPPESDWSLTLRADGAHFGALVDRRRFAREGRAPAWSSDDDQATFLWPAGHAAMPAASLFPLHVFAPGDVKFEVRAPGVDQKIPLVRLRRNPVKLAPAGVGAVSLLFLPGDAEIDLAQGLGTRDFAQEWIDEAAEPGTSWYYARVVQVDGEMAWSSPIFVTRR